MQICEDVKPNIDCFQPSCTNITRPKFEKKCREIFDEKCEVIIEQATEQQCKDVEQTEYEEQCTTVMKEECTTVQEYKCEQQKSEAAPDSYGVPKVRVLVMNCYHCGDKLHLLHMLNLSGTNY